MLPLAGGFYLGWALGANDAANLFGTAVAARIVRFRQACWLGAGGIILGALLQGERGIQTLSGLTGNDINTALIIAVCAALTVTLMTFLRLPISTSQAAVGAIVGIGLVKSSMHWDGLIKILICWVATPIGAMIIAAILYHLIGAILTRIPMSMFTRDKILWSGLIVVGVYGSYALGANNVANTTGVFSGLIPGWSDRALATAGGVSIALGFVTFGDRVMRTVGSGIMRLDAFTAFVTVLGMAVTVHVFAMLGVPVSASQAIIGAIMGVGFQRGVHVLHFQALRHVVVGWLMTPALALGLSAASYSLFIAPPL